MKKIFAAMIWTVLLTQVGPVSLLCYPSGIIGATMKSGTTGCSCHTFNSGFAVTISGPATLTTGSTGTYTVSSAGSKNGVDIAASRGTLTPLSVNLKSSGDELTHTASSTPPFTFTFTAPLTPGIDTLDAASVSGYKGSWNFAPNFIIIVTSATSIKEQSTQSIPSHSTISQNYPNPFNPSTTILFSMPAGGKVRVCVFDLNGKNIATLVDGVYSAGTHIINFDGSDLPLGIYFYRLQTGQISEVRRMLLLK